MYDPAALVSVIIEAAAPAAVVRRRLNLAGNIPIDIVRGCYARVGKLGAHQNRAWHCGLKLNDWRCFVGIDTPTTTTVRMTGLAALPSLLSLTLYTSV